MNVLIAGPLAYFFYGVKTEAVIELIIIMTTINFIKTYGIRRWNIYIKNRGNCIFKREIGMGRASGNTSRIPRWALYFAKNGKRIGKGVSIEN